MSKLRTWGMLAVAFLVVAGLVALVGPGIAMAGDGATPVYAPEQDTNCIRGTVIDQSSAPAGNGWLVTLSDSQGQNPVTTTVGLKSPGTFAFGTEPGASLQGGDYSVRLSVPPGYNPITPAVLGVYITGNATQTGKCLEIQFKVEKPGYIQFWKFAQEKKWVSFPLAPLGGGLWPASYQAAGMSTPPLVAPNKGIGLVGWEFEISMDPNGPWTKVGPTDNTGTFVTGPLTPGTWYVREVLQAGWTQQYPHPDKWKPTLPSGVAPVLVTAGNTSKAVFVDKQIPTMCIDIKKIDADGNLLGGWEFTATQGDVAIKVQTSSGAPNKLHEGLARVFVSTPGVWTITETLKDNWTAVSPSSGAQDVTVDVVKNVWKDDDSKCAMVIFKNVSNFKTIDVYKMDSDTGKGLANWEVWLYRDSFVPVSQNPSLSTNAVGWGQFSVNPVTDPGPYWVCEAPNQYPPFIPDPSQSWKWVGTPIDKWCVGPLWVPSNNPAKPFKVVLNNCQDTGHGQCAPKKMTPGPKAPDGHHGNKCDTKYTVRAGDTLTAIGMRFHVSVKDIQGTNDLHSTLIRSGQSLCIPPDP